MTDDAAGNRPVGNRVSIRAVLAFDGEDVTQALSQAGIFDPVVVPATLGDAEDPPGGILGDGFTPNLTAAVEPGNSQPDAETDLGAVEPAQQGNEAATNEAPVAVKVQSFAPIRGHRR
ncbi:MAG: hypothetical protein ACJ8AW_22710 [Rhodopila sp.]|jgi:hypothetical protein